MRQYSCNVGLRCHIYHLIPQVFPALILFLYDFIISSSTADKHQQLQNNTIFCVSAHNRLTDEYMSHVCMQDFMFMLEMYMCLCILTLIDLEEGLRQFASEQGFWQISEVLLQHVCNIIG